MTAANITPWVITLRDSAIAIAAVCGALVTIAAAAKLPVISRPVRWMWAHLVADPLAAWISTVIDPHTAPLHDRLEQVEHEVRTNDGSSLRDVADRMESELAAQGEALAAVAKVLDALTAEVCRAHGRVD